MISLSGLRPPNPCAARPRPGAEARACAYSPSDRSGHVVSPFSVRLLPLESERARAEQPLSPRCPTARLSPPYRSCCEPDSCVLRAARASEITAVCDLVGARLALRSDRSLPGGTVEEASGVWRTPRKSPPIFFVSPLGAAQAPAAGGRASDAHSVSPSAERVTLHQFRHGLDSFLDAAGISEARADRYMGHAGTTVGDLYRHRLRGPTRRGRRAARGVPPRPGRRSRRASDGAKTGPSEAQAASLSRTG
jgi:hypothetical protein